MTRASFNAFSAASRERGNILQSIFGTSKDEIGTYRLKITTGSPASRPEFEKKAAKKW